MSNVHEHSLNLREYSRRVMMGAALGSLSLATAAKADSSGHSTPRANQKTPVHHLIPMSETPGYALRVNPLLRAELANSEVKIVLHDQSNRFSSLPKLREHCQGTVVSLPGVATTEVLTNDHCFAEETGAAFGDFYDTAFPGVRAENFMQVSAAKKLSYTIVDPQSRYNRQRDHYPIGLVNGESLSTNREDAALLSVSSPDSAQIASAASMDERPFDSIPGIPAEDFVSMQQEPPIGEQVAIEGTPAINHNVTISATGRYVGRYKLSAMPGVYDWVAVKVPYPKKNPCQHGVSGGSGAFAIGNFTGGLSEGFTVGYGPKHLELQPKNKNIPGEDYPQNKKLLKELEQKSGINLGRFSTFCGYTVLKATFWTAAPNGFNFMKNPSSTATLSSKG